MVWITGLLERDVSAVDRGHCSLDCLSQLACWALIADLVDCTQFASLPLAHLRPVPSSLLLSSSVPPLFSFPMRRSYVHLPIFACDVLRDDDPLPTATASESRLQTEKEQGEHGEH